MHVSAYTFLQGTNNEIPSSSAAYEERESSSLGPLLRSAESFLTHNNKQETLNIALPATNTSSYHHPIRLFQSCQLFQKEKWAFIVQSWKYVLCIGQIEKPLVLFFKLPIIFFKYLCRSKSIFLLVVNKMPSICDRGNIEEALQLLVGYSTRIEGAPLQQDPIHLGCVPQAL